MEKRTLVTKNDFLDSYKLRKFGESASKNIIFPIIANKNLAKLVSYITFDGHLSMTERMFYLSSSKISELDDFKNIVKEELGIKGKIVKTPTSIGTSYKYLLMSGPSSRILKLIGTPKGAKVKVIFNVPEWILNDINFTREYLKVAFDCEGGIWKDRNRIQIRFSLNKAENFIENGIEFMNTIKNMLHKLNISTTNIWLRDSNMRKDGLLTKVMAFNISTKSIKAFKSEIGFRIQNKSNKLRLG